MLCPDCRNGRAGCLNRGENWPDRRGGLSTRLGSAAPADAEVEAAAAVFELGEAAQAARAEEQVPRVFVGKVSMRSIARKCALKYPARYASVLISEYTGSKPFLAADMTLSLNGLYANDRVEIITEADPEELEN